MSDDCVFCGIVAGDVPSHTVYEDETTIAFLDANPLSRGHTVVIPKDHHGSIQSLPESLARDLFATIRDVVTTVEDALEADGSNVGFNNGEVAGQVVPHTHCHVVPRFEGDGGRTFHAVAGGRADLSDDDLADIAAEIRAAD